MSCSDEYLDSQDDSANSIYSSPGKEYDDSVKKLMNNLEKSVESLDSQNSTDSNIDTTVVDTENKIIEPGEKSPIEDTFVSSYASNPTGVQYKTLSLPNNVISNLLDFQTNNYYNTHMSIGGVGNS